MREVDGAEGRPLVGDVIAGKYRIDSVAGEGGMGIVYEAEHVILRQRVAVKALHPGAVTSPEALERFSLEASAIARITSEHVVRIMDAGSLPSGAPYLVMEYLDGCDLDELLARRGPLPPADVVDFALQALDALAHAHAARVVHRDLKPANLFLATSPGGRQIIKLVDFGVAKSFDLSADDDRVAGSPTYMSPEQLANAPIDPRTDLWSLGVVMYELLAGAPPFVGTFSELVASILGRDAVPLSERIKTVVPDLSRVIGRCLRRDPADRWGTTADLAHALVPHGTGHWTGALERIERALSLSTPMRAPRRFESFENALHALEGERHRENEIDTLAPPEDESPTRSAVPAHEGLGDTLPAPPSEGLPAGMQVVNEALSPASARPALRILLIDDSVFVLGLHAEVLTRNGFDVKTTTSVREFDVLLESWRPHLVLMDVQMPGMNGDELCRRVKARFRATVPVVFLSDLPREVLARRAKVGGADAFLSKSSDWAAFVDFVRNICAMTYSPEDLP